MNKNLITRTIRDSIAESVFCEGFSGDILVRVNENCEVYKIIYNYVEYYEPDSSIESVIENVKKNYPDATSVTFHFTSSKVKNRELGKVEINFLERTKKNGNSQEM